jgi:hypothetical protein
MPFGLRNADNTFQRKIDRMKNQLEFWFAYQDDLEVANIPQYPANLPQYPANLPQYPANLPQYPANLPQYPANFPSVPSHPSL